MRVLVTFGETKLVIPIGNDGDKVSRLISDINRRFQSHLGDPTARVKELWLSGFYVNPYDTIRDVLENGDSLQALDFNGWLKANLALLENPAFTIKRWDYSVWPNVPRTVEVGKHKHNKLYIKLSHGKEVDRLELFDADSLETFGKSGTPLIARMEETGGEKQQDWFTQACFIVKDGVASAIEVQAKATSDKRPEIVLVPIARDLSIGAQKQVQTAELPKPDKVYTAPPPAYEGPVFPAGLVLPVTQEPSGIPKRDLELATPATSTTDAGLNITQKDPILADQGWYDKNTKGFHNLFFNNFDVVNPSSDKRVIITKIESHYQNKDGQWVPAETYYGTKSGYYNFWIRTKGDESNLTFEGDQRNDVCVRSGIFVGAPTYNKQCRAHASLPSPLLLRVRFVNKEGEASEIVTKYEAPPLYLPNQETRAKAKESPQVFYLQADDVNAETRAFVEVRKVTEGGQNRLEIYTNETNKNKYLYQSSLSELVYNAEKKAREKGITKQAVLEEPITEVSFKEGGDEVTDSYSIDANLLIDAQHSYAYGIKFDVRTSTSRATATYLLPDWTTDF